jgi:hypothetical protein
MHLAGGNEREDGASAVSVFIAAVKEPVDAP